VWGAPHPGAVEDSLPAVPVVTVGEDDADDIARIVSQWHENEYRAAVSTADRLAAIKQLSPGHGLVLSSNSN
jgi:ParB family chromosome partitioning protein